MSSNYISTVGTDRLALVSSTDATLADQPTYYHMHIHIVHAMLEAGTTQSVGKAFSLENIISQLEAMPEGKSMADVSLTYFLGEQSELWTGLFGPLKSSKLPSL